MTATIKFISNAVGDGLHNDHNDVGALQQLLLAAGVHVHGGADRRWGKSTAGALSEYQKKKGVPQKARVDLGDELLLKLAMDAKILIPMPGLAGVSGLLQTHKWFADNGIKYQQGAESGGGNRAIYGLEGTRSYAVQTTDSEFRAGPVQMDCTTYVNLMLSIYIQGHAHMAPYEASCKAYGEASNNHCARERYGLQLVNRLEGQFPAQKKVNYFKTADQIIEATRNSAGRLFVLEVGGGSLGGVKHMALYLNGDVYECTTHQPNSACIKRNIALFMANKQAQIIYLFGPR